MSRKPEPTGEDVYSMFWQTQSGFFSHPPAQHGSVNVEDLTGASTAAMLAALRD